MYAAAIDEARCTRDVREDEVQIKSDVRGDKVQIKSDIVRIPTAAWWSRAGPLQHLDYYDYV